MEDYWKSETKNGGGMTISIMYPQYYLSSEDLVNPLRITYKNYYYYFSPKTFKIDRFFFNLITLIDDQGWIFEDIHSKTSLSLNKIGNDQNVNDIVDGKSSQMYELNLYMEKGSQSIKRSYTKIQDVEVKVEGIIMLFFSLMNTFFNSHKIDITIFSKIFDLNNSDIDDFNFIREK